MRPAPILRCPTSEFPIWSRGRPTARPEASSVVHDDSRYNRSKHGVAASAMAFDSDSLRQPKPSMTMRMRKVRSVMIAPAARCRLSVVGCSRRDATISTVPLADGEPYQNAPRPPTGLQTDNRQRGKAANQPTTDNAAKPHSCEPCYTFATSAQHRGRGRTLQDRRDRSHRHGLQAGEATAPRVTATVPWNQPE